MIEKALIISPEFIKQITGINDAITEEIILPHILIAQELYLEEALGTTVYEAILAGEHTEFKEKFVYPFLSWASVKESLPLIYQRIGNGGVFINNPDGSQAASTANYAQMLTWAETKSNAYRLRMEKNAQNLTGFNNNTNFEVRAQQKKVVRGISL